MPQIFQMKPQMANLIAAGEVVERPGSVIKELVENAVDAGAKSVTVEIRNGGVSYMRVTDDGKGILPEDVRTAFLRHATSKVREEKDLLTIGTLGFRGEALAAIAAVSKVDLFSRTREQTEGTQISIEGGEETGFGETGCPAGTTVVIRELFFNVPARAKFLKKDATEGSHVENIVMLIAVSHPEIAFRLIKDNRESFSTPGDGRMLSAIYATGGKELAGRMLTLCGGANDIDVSGHIAPSDINRANRSQQNFFINGRWVRSKLLTAAVEQAYKGRLMTGRYPVCYLKLNIHPAAVDVNVHPAKLEVKFSREKEVFSAVYHAVVSALEGNDDLQELKLGAVAEQKAQAQQEGTVQLSRESFGGSRPIPVMRETFAARDLGAVSTHAPTYHCGEGAAPAPAETQAPSGHLPVPPPYFSCAAAAKKSGPYIDFDETLEKPAAPHYETAAEPEAAAAAPQTPVSEGPAEETAEPDEFPAFGLPAQDAPAPEQEELTHAPKVRVLGELFHTYVLAEDDEGVWLIDKHAAHERMLFNKLYAGQGERDSQLLLTPQTVTLSQNGKTALLEHRELLERAGFVLEDFGPSAVMVREMPMYLDPDELSFVLSDVAERVATFRGSDNELFESLLKSMSCKAAIKAGMVSDPRELQIFAERVMADENVRNCPHGRPCVAYVTKYQLEKLFKRIV